MMTEENKKVLDDLVYLAACAVNGQVPEKSWTEGMDLSLVYEAAQNHKLAAAAGMALESAGIRNGAFVQAVAKAMRKNALLDADRAELTRKLEEAGIWYMPLKGAILKDLYPRYGMREMADNDILVDASRAKEVSRIMQELGFKVKEAGKRHHDEYWKPPVSNFEIHRMLFSGLDGVVFHEYYTDVEKHLIPDKEGACGRHFSTEDFYLYLVAHECKHYRNGGTGIRSLLDTYVFLKHYGDKLNMDYVAAEAEKMGTTAFEKQNRKLAIQVFGGETLTEADRERLTYYASSGAYGTFDHDVANKVNDFGGGFRGKIRFFLSRLFMPMDKIKYAYPLVYRHKILLPFLYVYRIIKGLTTRRGVTMADLKALKKTM
ncbi:MAG: nucleotidyltransferase family protein [Clostridia bacterium]|nr:nucleotidyltransferase family protein [Clostridia bacterium]